MTVTTLHRGTVRLSFLLTVYVNCGYGLGMNMVSLKYIVLHDLPATTPYLCMRTMGLLLLILASSLCTFFL